MADRWARGTKTFRFPFFEAAPFTKQSDMLVCCKAGRLAKEGDGMEQVSGRAPMAARRGPS